MKNSPLSTTNFKEGSFHYTRLPAFCMSYHRHSYSRGNGRTSVFNRLGRRRQDYNPSYHPSTFDDRYLDDDQHDEYASSPYEYQPYDGYMEDEDDYVDTMPPRYGSYRQQQRYHSNYHRYEPSPSPPPTHRSTKRVGSYSPSEIIITAPLNGGRIVSKGEQSSHPQMLTASFTPSPSTTPGYDTAVPAHISPPQTTAVWLNQQPHQQQPPYSNSYPVIETSHPPPMISQPLVSQHHELPSPTTTRYLNGSELNQIAMTTQQKPSPRRGGDTYIPNYSRQSHDGSRPSKKQRIEPTKPKHSSNNDTPKATSAQKSASNVTSKARPEKSSSPKKQASPTKNSTSTTSSSKGKSPSSRVDEKPTTQPMPPKASFESKKKDTVDTSEPKMDHTQSQQPVERKNGMSPSGESVISMDIGIGEQSDIMLPDWSIETEEEFAVDTNQQQEKSSSSSSSSSQQHDKEESKLQEDDDARKQRQVNEPQRQQDQRKQQEQPPKKKQENEADQPKKQKPAEKKQEQDDENESKQHDLLEKEQSSAREPNHGKRERPEEDDKSQVHVKKQARKGNENHQPRDVMQNGYKEDINAVQHGNDSDNQGTSASEVHDQLGTTTQDRITREEKDVPGKSEQESSHVAEQSNVDQHQKEDNQEERKQNGVKHGLFDTEDDRTLPKPWQAIVSSRGYVYYYNTETGLSTWERPKASPPPPSSSPSIPAPSVEENDSTAKETTSSDNNNDTSTTTTTITIAPTSSSSPSSSSTDKDKQSQPEKEKEVHQQQQQQPQRDVEKQISAPRDPRLRKGETERKKSPTTLSSSSSSSSLRRSTNDSSLRDRSHSSSPRPTPTSIPTNDKRYRNDRYYDSYSYPRSHMDSYRPNYGPSYNSSSRL